MISSPRSRLSAGNNTVVIRSSDINLAGYQSLFHQREVQKVFSSSLPSSLGPRLSCMRRYPSTRSTTRSQTYRYYQPQHLCLPEMDGPASLPDGSPIGTITPLDGYEFSFFMQCRFNIIYESHTSNSTSELICYIDIYHMILYRRHLGIAVMKLPDQQNKRCALNLNVVSFIGFTHE